MAGDSGVCLGAQRQGAVVASESASVVRHRSCLMFASAERVRSRGGRGKADQPNGSRGEQRGHSVGKHPSGANPSIGKCDSISVAIPMPATSDGAVLDRASHSSIKAASVTTDRITTTPTETATTPRFRARAGVAGLKAVGRVNSK